MRDSLLYTLLSVAVLAAVASVVLHTANLLGWR